METDLDKRIRNERWASAEAHQRTLPEPMEDVDSDAVMRLLHLPTQRLTEQLRISSLRSREARRIVRGGTRRDAPDTVISEDSEGRRTILRGE